MWPDDFADWYEWAYPHVYRAVYWHLRSRGLPDARARELAEEATQEAACRAAERTDPGYFQSQEHFRNWMITVARRYADERLAHERAVQLHEGHDAPASKSSRAERFGAVWDCFSQLSAEEQNILDWYYWDGLTDVEIGQILFDPSEGTPAALGQRARRRRLAAEAHLRGCLLENGIAPEDWHLGPS